MRTYLDCYPCFLNQALRAARIATNDETRIKSVLDEVGVMLKYIPMNSTPPQSCRHIYRKVHEITNNWNPYEKIKIQSTQKALSLYPYLKMQVEKSENRLLTSLRLAIAGNVIDFGPYGRFDLDKEVDEVFKSNFAVFDYNKFKAGLDNADEVLYIGDNAGECVFDRILIEEFEKPVTYVVRESPIINDAVYDDAVEAGLDNCATIISSGVDAPGTTLEISSPEFKKRFYDAPFIISKGQGNYEALSNEPGTIFFLLKVKCHVIAEHIGVDEGAIVLQSLSGHSA